MLQSRYVVVLGASLTQFAIIGILFSFGLFFKEFEAEFGWSRTLLSSCTALSVFMMGALAILGGQFNDKFGPRIVLSISGLCYGIGFILISQVTQPWQLFALFGTFLAIGLSTHDVVTLSTVARWFEQRRGFMSGVVKVGTALGQMTLPPVMAYLIITYGWRQSTVILGLGATVILLVAAMMMRHAPHVAEAKTAEVQPGLGFAEAKKTRTFWKLCAIQFLFFPTMMAVPLHIAVHGMDLGMTGAKAATLLSVIGGSSIAGRLIVGGLVDRIGGKLAFAMCFTILALSLGMLIGTTAHASLFFIIGFYGFAHGGLFTVVSPTVASYFGMRAHGAIFGTVLFSGTIGGAAGPILTGFVFDQTGSYQLAFVGLATLAVFGLILVLSLPSASKLAEVTA